MLLNLILGLLCFLGYLAIFISYLNKISDKGIVESAILHKSEANLSEWNQTGKVVKREKYAYYPTKVNNTWIWRKPYFNIEIEHFIISIDDSVMGNPFDVPLYSYEVIEQSFN